MPSLIDTLLDPLDRAFALLGFWPSLALVAALLAVPLAVLGGPGTHVQLLFATTPARFLRHWHATLRRRPGSANRWMLALLAIDLVFAGGYGLVFRDHFGVAAAPPMLVAGTVAADWSENLLLAALVLGHARWSRRPQLAALGCGGLAALASLKFGGLLLVLALALRAALA